MAAAAGRPVTARPPRRPAFIATAGEIFVAAATRNRDVVRTPIYTDMQGKVALVTVGSSGIGFAVVGAFTQQWAWVVIASRREAAGRRVNLDTYFAGAAKVPSRLERAASWRRSAKNCSERFTASSVAAAFASTLRRLAPGSSKL